MCKAGGILKKITVMDFSREGLGVLSDDFIEKGENLEIEMLIPGDNIPIIVSGEIAWTKQETSQNGKYKGGIKLNKVNNKDVGKILSLIYGKWLKKKG